MKNKGITLISLIVTIIIMIILASVTVNLITDGGIVDKTRDTTKNYTSASEQEELELAVTTAMDDLTGIVDREKLVQTLEDWDVSEGETPYTCISPSENKFTLTSAGKITLATGDDEEEIIEGSATFIDGENEVTLTWEQLIAGVDKDKYEYDNSYISVTEIKDCTMGEKVGVGAFVRNSSLKSITIPNTVTKIGASACDGCENLVSVSIPNSVKSIGERAFLRNKLNKFDNTRQCNKYWKTGF